MLDIKEQSQAVLAEAKRANVGRAARTLVKEGPLRLTIVGFTAGSSLGDHNAGGPVSIQVLLGTVDIRIGERSERLDESRTLVLATNVQHSLTAASDAVILLTIGMQV